MISSRASAALHHPPAGHGLHQLSGRHRQGTDEGQQIYPAGADAHALPTGRHGIGARKPGHEFLPRVRGKAGP